MAEFDSDSNRLTLKLVYYGPAQSGKTTNLMRLHDLLAPEFKGEMMVLDTHNDRTLFFDLLPLGFRTPSGLLIKSKLLTVPGQVVHDSTRKAILSRADGVVFVADSQLTQRNNNAEAFANLEHNCARVGLDLEQLPVVIQYNKRDLAAIVTEPEVRASWEGAPWPLHFSAALQGQGVRETLAALLLALYRQLDPSWHLGERHGLTPTGFVRGLMGDLAADEVEHE